MSEHTHIGLHSISRTGQPGPGRGAWNAQFIGRQGETIVSVSMSMPEALSDEQALAEARAKAHAILHQLADQTKGWARG